VDRLTTQSSTRAIRDVQGRVVYVGLTARQIFDPGDASGVPTAGNTFAALQSLVTAFQSNDTAGITQSIGLLDTVSSYLNQQQAYYGNAEQRIASEQNDASNQVTALQTQISGIRDTDVAQAATALTQLTTDQSAALAAQAQAPRKSLFDYLG
jgi:flagellin-like hook-associated protein FlgL